MATSTMVGDATWTRPSRTHSFDGGEKGKKFIDLLSLAAPKKYENENQQKANADDCAIFCCFVAPLYKTVPHPPAPPSPPNEAGNPCKWRLIEDLLGGSPLWLDGWPLKCDLEASICRRSCILAGVRTTLPTGPLINYPHPTIESVHPRWPTNAAAYCYHVPHLYVLHPFRFFILLEAFVVTDAAAVPG